MIGVSDIISLPKIGDALTSRINDNFQVLNPASWMLMGI